MPHRTVMFVILLCGGSLFFVNSSSEAQRWEDVPTHKAANRQGLPTHKDLRQPQSPPRVASPRPELPTNQDKYCKASSDCGSGGQCRGSRKGKCSRTPTIACFEQSDCPTWNDICNDGTKGTCISGCVTSADCNVGDTCVGAIAGVCRCKASQNCLLNSDCEMKSNTACMPTDGYKGFCSTCPAQSCDFRNGNVECSIMANP